MEAIKKILKKIPGYVAVLVLIVLGGIFLRAYHFHDFLRFNADQSRDAGIISAAISEKTALPLLGPKAGGTDFRLGPIFYEFQYLSAKMFGAEPDKMAYPDLFFACLSILLLFFFLRKLFAQKIALGLTALFAVSFFAVKYSHFAWNPNSMPFWTMLFLFSLDELLREKNHGRWGWPIVAGIALGVSVQLHTFLLISFPLIFLAAISYFSWKQKRPKLWKSAAMVCALALLFNTAQLVSEFKTKGENTGAFFQAIVSKDKKNNAEKNLWENIQKDGVCFAGGSAYILSSLGSADECQLYDAKKPIIFNIALGVFAISISLGGLILAFYFLRKKEDTADKQFLQIILAYMVFSFLLFLPLIQEISLRYFLGLIFMPFVFLGFGYKFLLEKIKGKSGKLIFWGSLLLLLGLNVFTAQKTFTLWSAFTLKAENQNFENTTLKEVEMLAEFMAANANGEKEIFLDGNKTYLFKFEKSLGYFLKKEGIKLSPAKKAQRGDIIFQLVSSTKKEKTPSDERGEKVLVAEKFFGRFSLLKWQKVN
jgi:hypothetical protein